MEYNPLKQSKHENTSNLLDHLDQLECVLISYSFSSIKVAAIPLLLSLENTYTTVCVKRFLTYRRIKTQGWEMSYFNNVLPLHSAIPSPAYPSLHAQVKPPSVLVHVALKWQLSTSRAHSSLSAQRNTNYLQSCGEKIIHSPDLQWIKSWANLSYWHVNLLEKKTGN